MTALVIAVLALLFLAWKAAKVAVLLTLVSLAVCAALATAIALAVGRAVRFGLTGGDTPSASRGANVAYGSPTGPNKVDTPINRLRSRP